jgi:hypothetical protein
MWINIKNLKTSALNIPYKLNNMFKILHLATATFVMGNSCEDLVFSSRGEIINSIFKNKDVYFIKCRGRNKQKHMVEVAAIYGYEVDDHNWGIIPKHQFEIVEV